MTGRSFTYALIGIVVIVLSLGYYLYAERGMGGGSATHFRRGVEAYRDGNLELAKKELLEAIVRYPKSKVALDTFVRMKSSWEGRGSSV